MVPKRKVYLHGHLNKIIEGRPFLSLAAETPGHALRLIDANFPGDVFPAFREGYYQVIIGDPLNDNAVSCDEHMMDFHAAGDIHFIPVPQGAGGGGGKGIFKIVLGVALIAAAFFFAPVAAAGTGFLGANLGATMFLGMSYGSMALMGLGMVLTGVAQLLTPTPETPQDDTVLGDYSLTDAQPTNAKSSFLYNGVLNTEDEGACVPVVYGRVMCGTIVMNGSIYTQRLDPQTGDTTISPGIINSTV